MVLKKLQMIENQIFTQKFESAKVQN
jgi:hypothetical protein